MQLEIISIMIVLVHNDPHSTWVVNEGVLGLDVGSRNPIGNLGYHS